MQISVEATDRIALLAFAAEAVDLLRSGQTESLVARYGYALAFGRDKVAAIRDDLKLSLDEVGSVGLAEAAEASHEVKYFGPNESGLVALVESHVPTNNGKSPLVELVVTGGEDGTHITLEQLSAV